jgi:hypothetical protein
MYLKEIVNVCTRSSLKALLNDSHNEESTATIRESLQRCCFTFEGMTKDATLFRHLLDGIAANTPLSGQDINSESAKYEVGLLLIRLWRQIIRCVSGLVSPASVPTLVIRVVSHRIPQEVGNYMTKYDQSEEFRSLGCDDASGAIGCRSFPETRCLHVQEPTGPKAMRILVSYE